jgi:hypothetical protein
MPVAFTCDNSFNNGALSMPPSTTTTKTFTTATGVSTAIIITVVEAVLIILRSIGYHHHEEEEEDRPPPSRPCYNANGNDSNDACPITVETRRLHFINTVAIATTYF